ncbi:MarR family winged helix-turn-helix transcriptional regulator [Actinacidiphila oryziradicis]|uniref:Winged helix-turn-helix transcriptional regulator n=1 Tax=Actinacidiphila oryziradicis TaxID=2571141 RepID=A0A4U0ST33_9ACTN|nr:MarR family winged helix-turn-helix transcriptional regulator [Actinacidiphila oryziradicis]TKA13320.1 winged helix-turn-helix transcriptional regulator [Actinacidiphila oryziradicis]
MVHRTENLLGALVTALGDAQRSAAEEFAGYAGATSAAMTYLLQEPGTGIDQLAAPLGLTQSATVRLVDRLERDGHARREPGANGRKVRVVLTRQGTRDAKRLLELRSDLLRDALSVLGPGDRKTLTGFLEQMLARLTTDVPHGQRICRMCALDDCPRQSCPVDAVAGTRTH